MSPLPHLPDVEQQLRQRGSPLTPQRRAILQFLFPPGGPPPDHPAASDVLLALQSPDPSAEPPSRATVYNTLALLENMGLLRTVRDAQGNLRYDPATDPHHHRSCPRCGRLEDIPLRDLQLTWRGQPAPGPVCFEAPCPGC